MVYRFIWYVVGAVIRILFRVSFVGRERIPKGPVIIAGNHASLVDPLVIALAVPVNRPVRFMGKSEMFTKPGLQGRALAWLMRGVHAFPVRRGEADREAITAAIELLKAGHVIGIFPEGTRHHEGMGQAQGGAAFIALRSGAPVVPAGVSGTDRIHPAGQRGFRLPRVRVAFGEAIDPASVLPDAGRRERLDSLTGTIMEQIEASMAVAARE